jgi:hypothetical protein
MTAEQSEAIMKVLLQGLMRLPHNISSKDEDAS